MQLAKRLMSEGYLLDVYGGAAGAWSVRKLKSDTTNVVRVRRSSDDSESDFTATEVTDGTLTTWVGGSNNGFITTMYDQSGNSNDATQTTSALQPRLVTSGSLETVNGVPAPDYLGTAYMEVGRPTVIADAFDNDLFTGFCVTEYRSSAISQTGVQWNTSFSRWVNWGTTFNSARTIDFDDAIQKDSFGVSNTLNEPILTFAAKNGTDAVAAENGNTTPTPRTVGSVTSVSNELSFGTAFASQGTQLDGVMFEFVFYDSDQDDQGNRSGIESNIASYYGITLA